MSGRAPHTVLEIARPQCAAEVLRDEVVALNVETGIYFSMRGLAAALWHDFAGGHAVETVAEHVRVVGGEPERVTAFAVELQKHGLMRPAADPSRLDGAHGSSALLADGTQSLVFEVYDDMQDLILSDPIHDVEDTSGWPHRRARSA